MYLLKRIPRRFSSAGYTRCYAALIQQSEKVNTAQNNEQEQSNYADKLLEKYKSTLLYNSTIQSCTMSFKEAFWHERNKERSAKQLKDKQGYIQPLPLSLKYYMEESPDVSETTEAVEEIDELPPCENTDNLSVNFPFSSMSEIGDTAQPESTVPLGMSIKNEMLSKKNLLDNWMTYYENYEEDLTEPNTSQNNSEINYGTPDPSCPISYEPCGGCGAHLHCQDSSIPGYIPSEIFKNTRRPGGSTLKSILCQRCHFLKEYNIALKVQVSPNDYPKVLQTVSSKWGLVILLVDLTDFPCSIWPGIADIVGSKTQVVVVGNKVDLLPKDDRKFLERVRKVLLDELKVSGFGMSNIAHIELISSKTGYGVESLITSLQKVWNRRGDVYIVGCTNVGKSTLFNILLQSDFCKVQAVNLVQRATTSPWPGTTLNLLKFPVTKLAGYRLYARIKRLNLVREIEKKEQITNKEAVRKINSAANATLKGRVERTFNRIEPEEESLDCFSMGGSSKMTGRTLMGLDERHPDFRDGKWCYDTPGVVHPDQILHMLTTEELTKILPKQIIRPETFQLKTGMTLFIAGLARLDYTEGPNPVRLTVFRAQSLPITVCHTTVADDIYKELLGTDLFQVPILKGDREVKWPGLELAKEFQVLGKCVQESSYDVVLSNAGWVAINCGLTHYKFQAWTPEKRGVHLREALLPKAVTLRGPKIRDSVAYKKHKFI